MNDKRTVKLSVASRIMLLIMGIGFFSVCYQIIAKNVVYDVIGFKNSLFIHTIKTDDNFEKPDTINLDLGTIYPERIENNTELNYVYKKNEDLSVYNSINHSYLGHKVESVYNMLDKYTSDYFTFTELCEFVSVQFNNCLFDRLTSDAYGEGKLFLKNGHLTYERPYVSMEGHVSNITDFALWLEEQDISYCHVIIPDPVSPDEEEEVRKRGFQVYSNKMADELKQGLESNKIDCLDLRELMTADGRTYTNDFFKYEHHMVPRAGLWAAGKIAKCISELINTSFDETIFDLNQYTITSVSKKSDLLNNRYIVYKGSEPLEMFYPKYETSFVKEIPSNGWMLTGEFKDVMYAMWDIPTYNVWNHGIVPLKTYRNEKLPVEQPRILLLTESYSDVVSPFLACAYANIDEIDLRLFNGSLKTYVEETKPDIVISMYSAYELNAKGNESLFLFD